MPIFGKQLYVLPDFHRKYLAFPLAGLQVREDLGSVGYCIARDELSRSKQMPDNGQMEYLDSKLLVVKIREKDSVHENEIDNYQRISRSTTLTGSDNSILADRIPRYVARGRGANHCWFVCEAVCPSITIHQLEGKISVPRYFIAHVFIQLVELITEMRKCEFAHRDLEHNILLDCSTTQLNNQQLPTVKLIDFESGHWWEDEYSAQVPLEQDEFYAQDVGHLIPILVALFDDCKEIRQAGDATNTDNDLLGSIQFRQYLDDKNGRELDEISTCLEDMITRFGPMAKRALDEADMNSMVEFHTKIVDWAENKDNAPSDDEIRDIWSLQAGSR